jgi:hypothetical protein
MVKAIKETPVLTGEDAKRFANEMTKPKILYERGIGSNEESPRGM